MPGDGTYRVVMFAAGELAQAGLDQPGHRLRTRRDEPA
jgi:hypothetical protein